MAKRRAVNPLITVRGCVSEPHYVRVGLASVRPHGLHSKGQQMIEKLEYGWQAGGGYTELTSESACDKINELVDAVNAIQESLQGVVNNQIKDGGYIATLKEQVNELQATYSKMENVAENGKSAKNAQDPYAEQRKWIGKLCRFWNFKDGAVDMGVLKAIDNLKPIIPYINDIDCSYAFCEPVKPTDSIIYKGGDNE